MFCHSACSQLLQLGMYPPWSEHYIAYDRLKRLIDRKVFLKKKHEAKKQKLESKERMSSAEKAKLMIDSGKVDVDEEAAVTELTPLTLSEKTDSFLSIEEESDSRSFLSEVDRELAKINKFFDSQVADLRVQLDELTEKWQEQHATHHNMPLLSSHLVEFKHLFLDLSALEEFGPLNRTGFYKIVKKYDKNMNEKNVKSYMSRVDEQNFAASQEPHRMIEQIAGYVSRSKLVEWKHTSKDDGLDSSVLFPSLRPNALAACLILFIVSYQLPPVAPHNPHANRCMSLLILVVSLWLTNAMPYFATAMLVPVLIPVLGVMREASSDGTVLGDMSPEDASKLILNSFFNHTTVRYLYSLLRSL